MQTDKKNMFFLILLILPLAGCSISHEPIDVVLLPNSAGGVPISQYFRKTQTQEQVASNLAGNGIAKRFQESASQGPTAVESAIELSKKYVEVSEEAALLRQKNQQLVAENSRLEDQVTDLNAQLQQAQKELTEANDLLIEMRIELNNWKTDILGFRDEMRDAEKAQLKALLKILNALGGEVEIADSNGL